MKTYLKHLRLLIDWQICETGLLLEENLIYSITISYPVGSAPSVHKEPVIEPGSDKDFVVFLHHVFILTVFRFKINLFKSNQIKHTMWLEYCSIDVK